MANGDFIDSYLDEGTVETLDATTVNLAQITLPTGTDGVFWVEAWAHGFRHDASNTSYGSKQIATGYVNGGTVTLKTPTELGPHDPDTSGYTVAVNTSGAVVRIRVTGAGSQSVRWHGGLSIRFREQAIT